MSPYHNFFSCLETYAEAERKIKLLEVEKHAFTIDNEDHAAAREQTITKRYKLKGSKSKTPNVAKIMTSSVFDTKVSSEDTGK